MIRISIAIGANSVRHANSILVALNHLGNFTRTATCSRGPCSLDAGHRFSILPADFLGGPIPFDQRTVWNTVAGWSEQWWPCARVVVLPSVDWSMIRHLWIAVWQVGEGFWMPKKGVTGHDEWVITEALATALMALEQLAPKYQPRVQMDEIGKLLAARCQPGTVNLHLAQAKCRLLPDIDPLTIYQEYGLGDGQG